MAIIVEGPDGGGKTTLIAELIQHFSIPVMPRVVAKDTSALVDLVQWTEEDNERPAREDVIYDRHRMISEPIYRLTRKATQPQFDNLWWMHLQMMRLYRREPFIIYCMPPKLVVKNNVKDDVDNEAVKYRISALYDAYVAKAAADIALYPRAVLWDYTNPQGDGLFKLIQRYRKGEL